MIKMWNALLAAFIIQSTCQAQNQGPISVWLTTTLDKANLLKEQPRLDWISDEATAQHVIDIDESVTYQEIDGFGASLSDSSAWLINRKLNQHKRQKLLEALFDKRDGIGLDMVRLSVGPSAFSVDNQTYDDTCCNVDDFNINRDKLELIPAIKSIQVVTRKDRTRGQNRNILFLSMGWSPPTWMKNSQSLVGGELTKSEISNFATYLWKYVRDYLDEGIPIYALFPQNEPQYRSCCYPSMWMDAETQANLIIEKLQPIFEKYKREYNHTTKIAVFSETWDNLKSYAPAVFRERKARDHVYGVGFTCYRGNVKEQSTFHRLYPEKNLWLLECTDEKQNNEAGTFHGLFRRSINREVVGSLRNWARGIMKGNLALDEKHGPTNGGCANCVGMVTIKQDGNYTLSAAYYAYGHVSKFIQRGSKRILSTSLTSTLETVAFKNNNGEKVLFVYNNLKEWPVPFKVKWGQVSFHHTVPPYGAATFVWAGNVNSRSAFERIEAESYTDSLGVTLQPCKDQTGCGESVGSVENEDFVLYRNIDFGTGANTMSLRIASERSGIISLKLDNLSSKVKLALITEKTGGYDDWVTKTADIPKVQGKHDVYLVFRGQGSNLCNLNWFVFGNKDERMQGHRDVPIDDRDYYKIVAKHSNKALEVDDGDRSEPGLSIRQWDFYYGEWQKFNFKRDVKGCYKIFLKNTKYLLDYSNDNIVKQSSDRKDSSQTWRVTRTPDGYYQFSSCMSEKVMQFKSGELENGAYLGVGPNKFNDEQKFSIVFMETGAIADEEGRWG